MARPNSFDQRLADLGIVLPSPVPPVAAYVPAVQANGLLIVSGQLPYDGGELMTGRIGEERDVAYGQRAARQCAVMLLAQVSKALGSLGRVNRVARLGVFVNCPAGFADQPSVANGASELMELVFGDDGRHARSAVGVPALPLGAAVEVDAIFSIEE